MGLMTLNTSFRASTCAPGRPQRRGLYRSHRPNVAGGESMRMTFVRHPVAAEALADELRVPSPAGATASSGCHW